MPIRLPSSYYGTKSGDRLIARLQFVVISHENHRKIHIPGTNGHVVVPRGTIAKGILHDIFVTVAEIKNMSLQEVMERLLQ
ncbi:unnamed protein product [Rotaria sordida]|uniref:Uncharacterized protein n=2 Tax=Rotaria sordida TaxID=392033 RepID=A0A819YNT6_9BILA|nr:unnamed protein product [Rotaria sordida]